SRMGGPARTAVGQIPQAQGTRHRCARRRTPGKRGLATGMTPVRAQETPMKTLHAALFAALALLAPVATAAAADDVVIVYDASGSMWGQIDGVSKLEIAREVMGDLVQNWSADTNLGLVAYGHRSEGDCRDIQTLIEPGPVDRASFIDTVNAIRPKGKTPISAAVQHAADLLSYRDNPATVVLISDGLDTCQADPCPLA